MLWRESTLIAQHQPRSLLNRCGYQLTDVVGESYVNVPHLLCGSEGTLALITEATLATQPLPRHRGVAMLLFDRLESAAQAVPEILAFKPGACDLLDRRHLSLARETSPEFDALIPPDTEALLLVEYAGDDAASVRGKVAQTIDRICRKKQLAFESRQALDPADVQTFWQLSQRVVPTLHRLRGTSRPVPIVEDVAVAPDALPDFLVRMQNTLKRHQITASLYGHVGHGQLHIRPFLDLSTGDDVRKMAALADDLYADVFELGGTISGEHGDGLSRTPVCPAAIRAAVRSVPADQDAVRSAEHFEPGQDCGRNSAADYRKFASVASAGRCAAGFDGNAARGNIRIAAGRRAAFSARRAASELEPGATQPGGGALQRLRGVPLATARRAHVPDLPRRPGRRSLAARQSQPAARGVRRAARSQLRWRWTNSRRSPICASIAISAAWNAPPRSTFPS